MKEPPYNASVKLEDEWNQLPSDALFELALQTACSIVSPRHILLHGEGLWSDSFETPAGKICVCLILYEGKVYLIKYRYDGRIYGSPMVSIFECYNVKDLVDLRKESKR